jgi:hypothetical protein
MLPVLESEINGLFDYLDENLGECNETLELTLGFLSERNLNKQKPSRTQAETQAESPRLVKRARWYCDCEVLANVEDKWKQVMK